ncbi:chorismate synthase [Candidatus Gracilibacteria bacterium]|nr:chorismate synthase [Candidatus Gracilibacteria bacterium]MCF7856400.1 chorismate synthase [Candidatus Gracilibacteria bacterium]MCF7896273.1 chorismate synthase [Candidatus Gracilibacteria bacterium]
MAGNIFGSVLKITTFGESHGAALGCVLDGVPAGIEISAKEIQVDLDRRRPGQSKVTTSRKEGDRVEILSGVFEGKTLGTPIALLIRNENQKSGDYSKIKNIFRPGHADFTWEKKFGIRDFRGGGRSSGRETVARVAAAALAKKILVKKRIQVLAHAESIGCVEAEAFDPKNIQKNSVRCADSSAAKEMEKVILEAQKRGDSVGGIIGIIVRNVPAGLGEPVFDKTEALLARALMSIGGVKGIEFGVGFAATKLFGSEMNDELISLCKKKTNRAGGIAGGITDGDEILIRLAVKPTASISISQNTVDSKGKAKKIQISGRHDPCLVPRIIPVAEAMVQLVLADLLLAGKNDKI